MNENVIEFLRGAETATVTFSQGRYVNKIRKLADEYPKECKIAAENSDGSIVAHIPTSWVRIAPRKVRNLSQEEREILRKRFCSNVMKKKEKNDDGNE